MELLDSTLVYDGFLKVFKNTYQTGDQTLVREVLERRDCVAAMVYNEDDNLFYFVSQPRPATFGKVIDPDNVIEIIAGVIDEGETAEQAMVREIREELGFTDVVSIDKCGQFFLSPGGCTELCTFFVCKVTNNGKEETNGIEDENIKVIAVSPQNLREIPLADAKTVIGVFYYFLTMLSND